MKAAFAIALLGAATFAQAQDVASWGKDTSRDYGACSMVGSAAMIMGRVGPNDVQESRACVEKKLQLAKAQFAALPPQTKPAAAAALKDYYAAWIAAISMLPSLLTQTQQATDSQSSASRQRLSELWAKFEIESGS